MQPYPYPQQPPQGQPQGYPQQYPPQQPPAQQYPPQGTPYAATPTAPAGWYPTQHTAAPAAAPQPQQAAPAAPPAPINLPAGGVGAPANSGDPNVARPRLAELMGRLLLCRPTKMEKDHPSSKYKDDKGNPTRADRLTVDVIVLDGPPFPYGGAPEDGKPHTHMAQVIPHEIPGMFINQTVLVDQLRDCLAGGPPMVCGRLTKVPSTKGIPAWKLLDATEAEMAQANAYVASRQTAQPGYATPQPPQMPPRPAQAAPAAPYAPQPSYGPPAAPAPYAPQGPAQPAYGPPAQAAPVAMAPAPGYDPAVWATYPPEVQSGIWAQVQAQQAQPQPGYAPQQYQQG